jgi:hypothetical protein
MFRQFYDDSQAGVNVALVTALRRPLLSLVILVAAVQLPIFFTKLILWRRHIRKLRDQGLVSEEKQNTKHRLLEIFKFCANLMDP